MKNSTETKSIYLSISFKSHLPFFLFLFLSLSLSNSDHIYLSIYLSIYLIQISSPLLSLSL